MTTKINSNKIAYSPVSNIDLSTIDAPALTALKYHQLLKLANRHNIMRRWAKKDDLIKSLLAAKSRIDNSVSNDEWKDGKEVFSELTMDSKSHNKGNDWTRLTFVISKEPANDDSRATFSLPKMSLTDTNLQDIDSRLTFNIPKDAAKLKPRNALSNKSKLTVPMSPVISRRDSATKLASRKDSPHKLSGKSITIKKDSGKTSMHAVKSIFGMKKVESTSVTSAQLPTRASNRLSSSNKSHTLEKENLTSRRKSKSDDPTAGRRSHTKPKFNSPPPTMSKQVYPAHRTKLPDFAALHQRQFEKMDSLDDFLNKRSERVKKLFGTPSTHRTISKVNNMNISLAATTQQKNNFKINKGTPSKKQQLNTAMKLIKKNPDLRTMTDVKDNKRSHIHGYRTNKRFELQMKFRNLLEN